MRRLVHLSLILGMAVFMAADNAKKEGKSDYDRLQGVWVVSESWTNGERYKRDPGDNDEALRFMKRKVEIGEFIRGKFADPFGTMVLELDESKSPKHMTLTIEGEPIRYVYSLKGDTLRMCVAEDSSEQRPKTLPKKGKKGEGLYVATLTRIRPKKP